MNSDIYINQVLEQLGLPFYKQCVPEKGPMIWMDDGAGYYRILPSCWANSHGLASSVPGS